MKLSYSRITFYYVFNGSNYLRELSMQHIRFPNKAYFQTLQTQQIIKNTLLL